MTKAGRWAAAAVMLGAVAGSGTALAQSSGTRSSSFAYDAASGLLTQEVVEPNTPALRLQTDYVYDAFGHKVSVTVSGVDIVSRASTTTYDAKGQFATSNTNALGQSESWQYDPRFGQPTSHTGPNGLTTTWSYDSFGRKIAEVRADGTQTKWAYLFCSGVNGGTASCPAGASYLTRATPFAADGVTPNGPVLLVYFDLLDREIARDTQGFDGSTIRATKQYDALGRVSKTSRPFALAGGTPQLTSFSYDALGRVVSATTPDGSITHTAYHGLAVTETNALNQTRTVTKNSQGQVVSVTDALGQTMLYAYDAFGNLVQTTDAVGNIVTATYDIRGRKVSSSDPDLGSWVYSYDTLGELTSQTDAKSQTVNLSYDKLGRLLQRIEPDMTCVWVYDSAVNGIGKLTSASITAGPGAGFQRSLNYDALGRPLQVATTIDGTTYTMGAAYDANGRLNAVTYPSGFTTKYGYNNLGYANQLLDAATNQVHWTANAIDAEGHLTQQTAGNGLVTTRSFSATNGRLNSIATGSGSAVQNLAYTYDQLGNPLSRSDANTNLSESFTYDGLNRLTTTTVNLAPTPLAKSFSYSPIGNLLSKSDVGNYSYAPPGSPQPHAVMGLSGGAISTTFTYDANGNQTSGLGRSIAYSSYNKPSSITQGTRTISFLDDTDHQRFKQITPEGATLYIAAFGVLAEVSAPGTATQKWTEYLSVGNAKVGMRVIQTASATLSTRYFHTDHLGSVSVITDENGNVVERLSYDAWGKRRFANGSDDPSGSITSQSTRGFTGEEELSVSGLVHLNGRVYDPLLARFTSADPTVTNPLDPQGWNRYSYVGNDPLAFTDPTGFSWFSEAFHFVSHAVSSVFRGVANFLTHNPIVRSIVQIGLNIALNAIIPGATFLVAAASAAITTGLSGGNFSQILKASAIAGATVFASGFLGGGIPAQAAIGCVSSVASGGSCGSGAASGAVSAGLSPITQGLFPNAANDPGELIAGTIIQATAGGLASVAGGGKFANGAATGAFGYLVALGPVNSQANSSSSGNPYDANASMDPCAVPGAPEECGGALEGARLPQGGAMPGAVPRAAEATDFVADRAIVTVGRVMSQSELDAMVATGRVQESFNNGVTSVTLPPNPGAYTAGPSGDVFVQFNVPRSAIGASDGVVAKIYGPNSIFGPAKGITQMPPATNIVPQ
jgi:RHS repeat-associated protein